MLIIAHDSFEASSHNATIEEELARAENWSGLLIDIIPVNRLNDCFRRAFRDKPNDFPVNAYDLKNAWQKIEIEEKAEAFRRLEGEMTENATANCQIRDKHIDDDRGKPSDGLIELYNPAEDSTRVVPCYQCRRRAFEQRQAEYIESKKGSGVPRPVTQAVDAITQQMTMNQIKPIRDDGRELLAWCSKEFIQEYLRNRPDENGKRKFSYSLFNRVWVVRLDEAECQRIGVLIHHAADYIKLGAERYSELKSKQA